MVIYDLPRCFRYVDFSFVLFMVGKFCSAGLLSPSFWRLEAKRIEIFSKDKFYPELFKS